MLLKLPPKELDNLRIFAEIHALKKYIEIIKKGVEVTRNEENVRIDSIEVNNSEDLHYYETEKEIFDFEFMNYVDGDFQCSQVENLISYSIIPICYMLLETQLTELARIVRCKFFLKLKYNELAGKKTEKFKIYMKLININVSNITSWQNLKDLETLRNDIIHKLGEVKIETEKEKNSLYSIVNRHREYITISKLLYPAKVQWIIKISLCSVFLNGIEMFFNEIIGKLGMHKNCLFGDEASNRFEKERAIAKEEYDSAIKMAEKIYNYRIDNLEQS